MAPVRFADLIENGWTRHRVATAVRSGRLRRIARGWYDVGTSQPHEEAALVAGARLGCLTRLRDLGVWVPPTVHPHLIVPWWSSERPRCEAVVHRLRRTTTWPSGHVAFEVEDCLRQVLRHHDAETALIVLESACHRQLITSRAARRLIAECPAKTRRKLAFFDPRAESGTETRVRLFLQQLGFDLEIQVRIDGVGRVDILVGESLIIECDSRAHHAGEDQYARDRRRDFRSTTRCYTVVRLRWEDVFLDWEETKRGLLRYLRVRRYRRAVLPD